MPLISSSVRAAALAASVLLSTQALAADGDVVVGLTNIDSVADLGSTENVMLNIGVAAGFQINQVRWDVSLTAYDPSWLSELSVTITNTAGQGITLTPSETGASGSGLFSGSLTLPMDLAFSAGADGRLNFEFHDAFDDIAGPDGRWNAGSVITLSPVPEPTTHGLMALGLLGLAAARRLRG
jgi:hypothetical protein